MALALPHRAAMAATIAALGALAAMPMSAIEPNPRRLQPPRSWFVDNTAAPDGDGSMVAPFDRLDRAERAADEGDTIYVFRGDGTSHGLEGGIRLRPYQRLIGSGAALRLPGDELLPVGERPRIGDGGGEPAIVLADHVRVEGLVLTGATDAVVGVSVRGVELVGLRAEGALHLRNPRGTVRVESSELHAAGAGPALVVDAVAGEGRVELEAVAVSGVPVADAGGDSPGTAEGVRVRVSGDASLTLGVAATSFEQIAGNAIALTATGRGRLRVELSGSGPVAASIASSRAVTMLSAIAREEATVEIAARGNDLVARDAGLLLSANGRAHARIELDANSIGAAEMARGVVVLLGDHAEATMSLSGNQVGGQRAEGVYAVAAAQAAIGVIARDNDLASGINTAKPTYAAVLVETRDDSRGCLSLADNRFAGGGGPALRLRQRDASVLAVSGVDLGAAAGPALAGLLDPSDASSRVEVEGERGLAATAAVACPALTPAAPPPAVAASPSQP